MRGRGKGLDALVHPRHPLDLVLVDRCAPVRPVLVRRHHPTLALRDALKPRLRLHLALEVGGNGEREEESFDDAKAARGTGQRMAQRPGDMIAAHQSSRSVIKKLEARLTSLAYFRRSAVAASAPALLPWREAVIHRTQTLYGGEGETW